MALKRGNELDRGVRRTQLENAFGVVKSSSASLGQIGGKLAETAEKITLFQADIMDKEWQNDFDTNSALFISEETNKELNSPNPDIVGLQQKLLTYKDKTLQDAPQRFQNYITNKLDIKFADNINLVKDYSNNLKFSNLLDKTGQLKTDFISEGSNYFDSLINNNKGDLPYIESQIDNWMLTQATPYIDRIAKNYESLNRMKPLKVTPTDIATNTREMQMNFSTIKFEARVKGILSAIDFENTNDQILVQELDEAKNLINDLIQDFSQNPENRDINNLSDNEVSQMVKNFETTRDNYLSFEKKKIDALEISRIKMIDSESKNFVDFYKNNPLASINSSPDMIIEQIGESKYLSQDVNSSINTINESIRATNIYKSLNDILIKNNNIYPDMTEVKTLVEKNADVSLDKGELQKYMFALKGGDMLSTYEYMETYKDIENNASMWGKHGDGKTINQVNNEKKSIQDIIAFEENLRNGIYPDDLKQFLSGVDGIFSKPSVTQPDLEYINEAFNLMTRIKNNNPDLLYNEEFGQAPRFFQYLEESKGVLFEGLNITDIGTLEGMVNDYKKFLEKPFDFNEAYNYIKDNQLDAVNVEVLKEGVIEDAKTQFGPKALFRWIQNPFRSEEDKFVQTTKYTDLFNIQGLDKYIIGLTAPLTLEGTTLDKLMDKMITIDPVIESQLQTIYVNKLNKAGVDFTLMGKDDAELNRQIEKHSKNALNASIRELRDQGFGMSKYEKKGQGVKLVYEPIESQMFYENEEDNDMVIAVSVFNRIKDMEAKNGIPYMMDNYPDLYYENFGTDTENQVDLTLNRVYESMIEKDGLYLTREPGTPVYRFNLDENVFPNNATMGRLDFDGDIDEEQFFKPGSDIVIDGQLINHKSIFGNAIDRFLESDDPIIQGLKGLNIDTEAAKNILYGLYYPGVKYMTSEEEIYNYLQTLTKNPYGRIE